MKVFALAVLAAVALLPGPALAASSKHVVLRVPSAYKHNMHFAHVTGSATLRYAKMDIYLTITEDGLPAPRALGRKYYVVWVTNGKSRSVLGVLRLHGGMGSLKGETMWHAVQDINVTAENSTHPSTPSHQQVLTAMVG